MSCTCYIPSKWMDPGGVAVCVKCEEGAESDAADQRWNAGARMADDLVCQCCGQRGHSEVTCAERCS